MPVFPSQEWCNALAQALNTSPEFVRDAKNYSDASMWIIMPEGILSRPVRIYTINDHGYVSDCHVMADDETQKVELTATAPFGVWRKIIEGKLHPVLAVVHGQLELQGMSLRIFRNAQVMQSFFDFLWRIPTEFPS